MALPRIPITSSSDECELVTGRSKCLAFMGDLRKANYVNSTNVIPGLSAYLSEIVATSTSATAAVNLWHRRLHLAHRYEGL